MAGKRSNGEGSILYDKRRQKPYRARITVGWEYDEKTGKTKQITKDLGSFKTKGEASRALAMYLDNPYDLDNKNITFKEFYEVWFNDVIEKEGRSTKARVKAAYKYCTSLYDKKFKAISIIDMKRCINEGSVIADRGKYKGEERFASPSTKFSMKYMFNSMFAYALEARIVERNYAKEFALDSSVEEEYFKNKKDKIPFSEEDLEKLWRSSEFVPFADMILYECYSGWRPGEIIDLKIENVDWENKVIKGGKKTQAGKNRLVPIHPLVEPIVTKYYEQAVKVHSQYLFNDIDKKTGIHLSRDQYLSRFNKVLETLNFNKEITPHCTRHTFITRAKKAGMNEYVLKLIVGHEINDITEQVYTHRDIKELVDEMNKITS